MALDLFGLYQDVLDDEIACIRLFGEEFIETSLEKKAVSELINCYSIDGQKKPNSLNFDRIELRCAYLFLYSTSHSHMVRFALIRYREASSLVELRNLMDTVHSTGGTFNVTSLGGGPGSDPVGFLSFLNQFGLLKRCPKLRVTVVDAYAQWENPFKNLMTRFYGTHLLMSQFITQNLLGPLSPEVTWNLRETHFLSMVKFLSAIAGDKEGTLQTLTTIFSLLPVGALVLVVDNSGGKAFKLAIAVARVEGLRPVFGPLCHVNFRVSKTLEPRINEPRFGFRAQTHCNISIMILEKKASLPIPRLNNVNKACVHRIGSSYGSGRSNFIHPYGRGPQAHKGRYYNRRNPQQIVRKSPVPDSSIYPDLFPGVQVFAQNISNSFGLSPANNGNGGQYPQGPVLSGEPGNRATRRRGRRAWSRGYRWWRRKRRTRLASGPGLALNGSIQKTTTMEKQLKKVFVIN